MGRAVKEPMGPAIAPPARAAPNATPPFNDMVLEFSFGLSQ